MGINAINNINNADHGTAPAAVPRLIDCEWATVFCRPGAIFNIFFPVDYEFRPRWVNCKAF
jgi:hypothetical protein